MRRFLSLLLVVLLLFSLLAVPASAMSAGAVVASYGGLEAVSAIISGLGLTIDSLEKFDSWNTLVSSASEYLTAQNIIDAVGTIAALKSGSKIYFPSSVVSSIRSFLFDRDYIVSNVSSSYTFTGFDAKSTTYSSTSGFPLSLSHFSFFRGDLNSYFYGDFVLSKKPFSPSDLSPSSGTCDILSVAVCSKSSIPSGYLYLGSFSSNDGVISAAIEYAPDISFVPSEGLSFGDVLPSADDSLEDNYPVRLEGAITKGEPVSPFHAAMLWQIRKG